VKDRISKTALRKMLGMSARTLEGWINKKWLRPTWQGGGRAKEGKGGVENEFDLSAAAWAMGLQEILRVWPKIKTPVYLWQFNYLREKNLPDWEPTGPQWEECLLSDGLTITNYLGQVLLDPDDVDYQLAVTLQTGYKGWVLYPRPSEAKQFAFVHIRPWIQVVNQLQHWFMNPDGPYTTIEVDKQQEQLSNIMQLIAIINLSEYYRRVCAMAKRM